MRYFYYLPIHIESQNLSAKLLAMPRLQAGHVGPKYGRAFVTLWGVRYRSENREIWKANQWYCLIPTGRGRNLSNCLVPPCAWMNKLLRAAVQVRSETFFEEITQQCSNIIIMCEKITVREVRAGGITKTLNRQVCSSHCMRFPRFLGRLCYDLLLCKQTQAGAIFLQYGFCLYISLNHSLLPFLQLRHLWGWMMDLASNTSPTFPYWDFFFKYRPWEAKKCMQNT